MHQPNLDLHPKFDINYPNRSPSANFGTKLQVAVASAGQNYVEGMQRDGTDGSGSGNGPDIEDDDDEPLRGSGSGNGQGVDEGEYQMFFLNFFSLKMCVFSDRTYNTNIDEVVPLRPSGNADASACAPTAPATLLTAVSLLILTFLT